MKIAKEENDLKTMRVVTAVQYRILRDKVDTAVFDIVNPEAMRRAEVDSILRSTLPTMDLDDAYSAKEKIMENIISSVSAAMKDFGYEDVKVAPIGPRGWSLVLTLARRLTRTCGQSRPP